MVLCLQILTLILTFQITESTQEVTRPSQPESSRLDALTWRPGRAGGGLSDRQPPAIYRRDTASSLPALSGQTELQQRPAIRPQPPSHGPMCLLYGEGFCGLNKALNYSLHTDNSLADNPSISPNPKPHTERRAAVTYRGPGAHVAQQLLAHLLLPEPCAPLDVDAPVLPTGQRALLPQHQRPAPHRPAGNS